MLIRQLPPGAALWWALGIDAAWTPEAHLLAAANDQLAGANWQRGGGKGQKPKPISRPSDLRELDERAGRDEARARAFLARRDRDNDDQEGG